MSEKIPAQDYPRISGCLVLTLTPGEKDSVVFATKGLFSTATPCYQATLINIWYSRSSGEGMVISLKRVARDAIYSLCF